MPRLPVRPLTGVLISTLMILMTTMLGAVPAHAVPATPGRAVELDTDLTLKIARCEGCRVTLLSNDGVNPIYSSYPAVVEGGSVTINLPSARTAGMSVRIEPTWFTTNLDVDTQVVWRYARKAIGDTIGFREARGKRWASGCWAGTVNEAVTLTIKVRKVRNNGRQGAIAWAPVTESFLRPMERVRHGVLVSDDVLACDVNR